MLAGLRQDLAGVPEHRTGRNTQYEIAEVSYPTLSDGQRRRSPRGVGSSTIRVVRTYGCSLLCPLEPPPAGGYEAAVLTGIGGLGGIAVLCLMTPIATRRWVAEPTVPSYTGKVQ